MSDLVRKHTPLVPALFRALRQREQPGSAQALLPGRRGHWADRLPARPFVQDLLQERTVCHLILVRIYIDPMNINSITSISIIPTLCILTMNRFCAPAPFVVYADFEAMVRSTGDEHPVRGHKSFDYESQTPFSVGYTIVSTSLSSSDDSSTLSVRGASIRG